MRWLLLAFLLALCAGRASAGVVSGSVYAYESEAAAACYALADSNTTDDSNCSPSGIAYIGALAACQAIYGANAGWAGSYHIGGHGAGAGHSYQWCVPGSCTGSAGSFAADPGQSPPGEDGTGCCATWAQSGSVSYGGHTWNEYDGSRNGSRCFASYSTSQNVPSSGGQPQAADPPNMCDPGQVSCYDPKSHQACYTTESGEQICTKLDQSDNCASGATGAVCYGKDGAQPPKPGDPPIPKDQAPDSTQTGSKTGDGGAGDNFTQNNYSGTSPGGETSGDSGTSAGGSQSNQNASGNSSGPQGDHGTDADGKCPDGSVPTASGCSGSATDAGCDEPPQAFGDAIMAAQFKELVAIRCNTQNAASGSSSGGDSPTLADVPGALAAAGVPADGGASGDPDASSLVGTQEIGEAGFDSVGLGLSRACPASPSFSFGGHTFTIDLTPFCNFLNLFGWLVLLASYLVGLRIVATGKA